LGEGEDSGILTAGRVAGPKKVNLGKNEKGDIFVQKKKQRGGGLIEGYGGVVSDA